LIKELLKNTEKDHVDYANLCAVEEKMNSLVLLVNNAGNKSVSEKERILAILSKIESSQVRDLHNVVLFFLFQY